MSLHHLGPDQPLCLPGPQFPCLMFATAYLEANVCPSWDIQPLSGGLAILNRHLELQIDQPHAYAHSL